MKVSLILACGGKGVRAGFDKNKLLVDVNGSTCFEKTFEFFANGNLVDQIIVAAHKDDIAFIENIVNGRAQIVEGGCTRTISVKNALEKVDGDIVLIHDGARPFVKENTVKACIDTAIKFGAAIPVIPTRNTAVKVCEEKVDCYLGKSEIFAVQTPQGFDANKLKLAYSMVGDKTFNDDGEVYQQYIGEVHVFDGDPKNIKLTFPQDFEFVNEKSEYRFGTGFDCHRLVENRKLILGGIQIEHDKGLLGHSDADVLTHAVMDAILSSLSLRDIGYHFSDKDPRYKDACSMELLKKVLDMITEQGYKVDSVSATVMAEKPKLLAHIPTITKNLAAALRLSIDKVGIGATTLEGLGFVGREEGICVHAAATLKRI